MVKYKSKIKEKRNKLKILNIIEHLRIDGGSVICRGCIK